MNMAVTADSTREAVEPAGPPRPRLVLRLGVTAHRPGSSLPASELDRIRAQLGLTQPLWTQFATWAGNLLQGDLGFSFFLNKPVVALIGQRIEPTLSLAIGTLVLAVAIALPLGTLAAWRMGGWLDKAVMAFSVAGFSVPVFVIGYVLIYLLAMKLQWFPVQGYRRIGEGVGPWARQLVLPCLTLAVTYVALLARVTRAAVSEALTEDYIRTARAKGLDPRRVVIVHALRNALIPVITVIGMQAGSLLAGAVLTETIFSWPGIGKWLIDSIARRDYPVVQAGILISALTFIGVNLVVDLLYGVVNPRIRSR